MPKALPEEFRRDVIAVARKGEAPLRQVAKDFGISEGCLHRWLKIADRDTELNAAPPQRQASTSPLRMTTNALLNPTRAETTPAVIGGSSPPPSCGYGGYGVSVWVCGVRRRGMAHDAPRLGGAQARGKRHPTRPLPDGDPSVAPVTARERIAWNRLSHGEVEPPLTRTQLALKSPDRDTGAITGRRFAMWAEWSHCRITRGRGLSLRGRRRAGGGGLTFAASDPRRVLDVVVELPMKLVGVFAFRSITYSTPPTALISGQWVALEIFGTQ
jgi:transposase-like protein